MNNKIEDWFLYLHESLLAFFTTEMSFIVSDNSQPELNKCFYEDGLLPVRSTCSPLQAPLHSSGINID